MAGDLTACFRSGLKACPTKHYCSQAGKALPAIRVGILGQVGSVGSQRWARPVAWVRSDPDDPSEAAHRQRLLREAQAHLTPEELIVLDRGFPRLSGGDRTGSRDGVWDRQPKPTAGRLRRVLSSGP